MTTIEFDKKVEAVADHVAIRIIENADKMEIDGILISSQDAENDKLAFGVIESVGTIAAKEYGIKVGDYCWFDRLSTYYHTKPVCITKYNNIIYLVDKDGKNPKPLRNMVFVRPNVKKIEEVGGILVSDYAKKIRSGVITAMNLDPDISVPYKVGDEVMLSRGPDSVKIGDTELLIYKWDMILAKIG